MTTLTRWLMTALGTVLLIGTAVAGFGCSGPPPTSGPATSLAATQPTINLDIKIQGAFTYIHSASKKTVHVVYLNPVNAGGCNVMQPEVNLRVLDGTITSAPPPARPNKNFPLDGVEVSLSTAADGIVEQGPTVAGPGDHPGNVDNPGMWADMKYVPNLFNASGYALDGNWQTRPVVNGWLELVAGSLQAWMPTEPTIKQTVWNFHTPSGAAGTGSQALTNTVWYKASIPGSSLTLTLTPHAGGTPSTIVLAPRGGHVLLALSAAHPESTAMLNPGDLVTDLCASYQLLASPPDFTSQLLPSYPGASTAILVPSNGTPTDRPRPGPFCPGDYAEAP